MEQMAKMCAAVRTTAFGGKHDSLASVLDDAEYQTVTTNAFSSTTPLTKAISYLTKLPSTRQRKRFLFHFIRAEQQHLKPWVLPYLIPFLPGGISLNDEQ